MLLQDSGSTPAGRRSIAVLLGVVFIGALVLWQVLDRPPASKGTNPAPSRGRGEPRPSRFAPVVKHASRLQSKGFSIFRTLPEGLPEEVMISLHRPTFGLNWQLAQQMPAPTKEHFWAVPGRGAICIVGEPEGRAGAVSLNCGTSRHSVEHGVAAVLVTDPPGGAAATEGGQRLIVGLAPDGAVKVRVYTHGTATTVPVVSGVFTLRDAVTDPPDRYEPVSSSR